MRGVWLMKRKLISMIAASVLLFALSMSVFAGEWQENSTGWWYQNDDGTNPVSEWKEIDGQWYYFRSDGYMATGWTKVSDTWYYLEANGQIRTADLQTDVFTFKFDQTNGACTNFYENTTPSAQAGWSHYDTSSLSTFADVILDGDVVYYNGEYWATPGYTSMLSNENVVYYHDVSEDDGQSVEQVDRYALANWVPDHDFLFPEDSENNNLDGLG